MLFSHLPFQQIFIPGPHILVHLSCIRELVLGHRASQLDASGLA